MKNKTKKSMIYTFKMPYMALALFALLSATISIGTLCDFQAATTQIQKIQTTIFDKPAIAISMVGKTIVIDAGHGGFDPGAVGVTGVLEKDVNLAVANRLIELLNQAGATVVATRTTDTALADSKTEDIHQRVAITENSGAELFITVQANSIPEEKWSGAQVFYAKDSQIGEAVAIKIQESMTQILENTDRTAKPIDNIYVVDNTQIPAIVVETGFLSNYEEEQLLATEEYQDLLAYSIFVGILAYYDDQMLN